ncbi:MAG: extracellular solute-binding protein [Chloroflexota bacterium]|nr:extracellular solute-binding protein [Chloroflexota bacterium]
MANHKRHRLSLFLIAICAMVLPLVATPALQSAAQEASPVAVTGSGDVSIWTEFTAGGEASGIDELVSTWNGMGNGVTVTHRPIGNEEFFTVIRTALAGGEPPDLLQYEGYQQTRDFAEAGQLTDLTPLWDSVKDRFALADAGAAACTFDGKIYCIPYTYATGWQVYYNPELLEANGVAVPQTWDEFTAAMDTLKAAGVTPISIGAIDGWPAEHWWMAFLVQRCGVDTIYQAINQDGASFTDECFTQAAADLQALGQSGNLSLGATSDDYGTSQALFLSGQAAFFQTGSWFAGGWEQTPPPFEVGIMSFPRFGDAASPDDVTGAVTHVFAIPTGAKNPEAAMDVLEWMTSPEAAAIWARNGNMSLISGAVEENSPQVIKDLWATVGEASGALPWIENELPPGVGEDKVYSGVVALLTGEMTPEQFGQSIQDGIEAAAGE